MTETETRNVLRAVRELGYDCDELLNSELAVRTKFNFRDYEPCVDGCCHERTCTHVLVEVKGVNFLKAVSQVRHCIEHLRSLNKAIREAVLVMRSLKGARGRYILSDGCYLVEKWTGRRFKIERVDVRYIERLD